MERPIVDVVIQNPYNDKDFEDDKLWAKDETAHHRFRLEDRQTGRVLKDTIEIHLVELPKYNLGRERLSVSFGHAK